MRFGDIPLATARDIYRTFMREGVRFIKVIASPEYKCDRYGSRNFNTVGKSNE